MKNIKVGLKLALAFAALLIIMSVLGGMASRIMQVVQNHSRQMAAAWVPETSLTTALERASWRAMYNLRGYGLSADPRYLDEGRQALAEVNDRLRQTTALMQRNPELKHLQALVSDTQTKLTEYEQLVAHTEDEARRIECNRQLLDEAAARFMTNCHAYVSNQQGKLEQEIDDGLDPASLTDRTLKLALAYAVVGNGNAIQLHNFKFQALRDPTHARQAIPLFTDIDATLARIREMTTDDANVAQLENIQGAARAYQAALQGLLTAWEEREALSVKRNDTGTYVLYACRALAEAGLEQVVNAANEAVDRLAIARTSVLAGLAGAVLLGLLITIGLTRSITRPLLKAVAQARQMAAGDFTQFLTLDRKDELGTLAAALNGTSDSLRRQIAEIKGAVGVLAASAGEISVSVSQVAAGSSETAAAVSETTATVEEVKQSSRLASESARTVAEAATRTAEIAHTGRKAAEETVDRMADIRRQMEAIADSIVQLSEQSQAIGSIITTVDDIAEQSNLLAVNAAIEAAKAGEQGRGFGVVAQEIKSLAAQSKQATGQVRTILADIQKATSDTVMATEQGSKAVEAGVAQSRQGGQSIETLAGSIQDSSQSARQIAASSQQQVAGMDQVAQAMANIKQASQQNVESMVQLKTAAQSLQDLGERLRTLVAPYKA
ncbi:MAG: methyl-accepting chemotaxis protein [Lentisphaerae bacterium]|nr:methyl-accepting chemotaxis protein [Lentisphaerota bacterium]